MFLPPLIEAGTSNTAIAPAFDGRTPLRFTKPPRIVRPFTHDNPIMHTLLWRRRMPRRLGPRLSLVLGLRLGRHLRLGLRLGLQLRLSLDLTMWLSLGLA
jgi:hypothetical protein